MNTPQHMSLKELAERYGDYPVLQSSNRQVLWKELPDAVERWQSSVDSLSLKSGDTCALYIPPSIDTILMLFAMWTRGIIAAPLNTRLPGESLLELLETIRCKTLISASPLELLSSEIHIQLCSNIRAEQQTPAAKEPLLIPLQNDATILFTSGSSGTSKACLHTIGNHYFSALGSNENIPLDAGDRWLLSLPLYHVAGMGILFRCLSSGATICVSEEKNLVEAISEFQPTHLSLVSTQLHRVLEQWKARPSILKAVLLGGSAIPAALIEKAYTLGLPLFTSYGSTEMASQVTTTRPNDSLERLLSSGRLLIYRNLRIDKTGEILVRGDTLFKGYVEKDSPQPQRDANGWFHTGDLGEIDDQGYLHILGRKDNMFISGGENIHPEEIEREILHIKGVRRVIVVDVEHEEFGRRPVAFVDSKEWEQTQAAIQRALPNILPKFKCPDALFPWPSEMDLPGVKINRQEFRNRAKAAGVK